MPRGNLSVLVAASPSSTRPIYVDGELAGVYDSASQSPPKDPRSKPVKHRYRPGSKPQSATSLPCPLRRKKSKGISKDDIRKVARRAGVKNPEEDAFDATRQTMEVKIEMILTELDAISQLTGKRLVSTRELNIALRCIDDKFFGVPCSESGILSTLRGKKL